MHELQMCAPNCVALQDRRHNQRCRGWAPRGRRTKSKVWFQRGQRFSTIGVMSARGMLDWCTIKGAASAADMVNFAKQSLVGAGLLPAAVPRCSVQSRASFDTCCVPVVHQAMHACAVSLPVCPPAWLSAVRRPPPTCLPTCLPVCSCRT